MELRYYAKAQINKSKLSFIAHKPHTHIALYVNVAYRVVSIIECKLEPKKIGDSMVWW